MFSKIVKPVEVNPEMLSKYESKNVRDLKGVGLFGGTDDVFVDYTNP